MSGDSYGPLAARDSEQEADVGKNDDNVTGVPGPDKEKKAKCDVNLQQAQVTGRRRLDNIWRSTGPLGLNSATPASLRPKLQPLKLGSSMKRASTGATQPKEDLSLLPLDSPAADPGLHDRARMTTSGKQTTG